MYIILTSVKHNSGDYSYAVCYCDKEAVITAYADKLNKLADEFFIKEKLSSADELSKLDRYFNTNFSYIKYFVQKITYLEK